MQYRVETLDSRTWLIEEYNETNSVYMYLLAGEERAVLIDTGFGGIDLQSICASLTDRPVTVLLTHGHVDHIGGTGYFDRVLLMDKDLALYRLHSEETMRGVFTKDALYPVQKEPTLLGEKRELRLGGRTLEIIPTPGHSVGSICILDKERRWLFTGDSCCKAHVLFLFPYSGTLAEYGQAMEALWQRREDYDLTWPGHHAKPVEKEIIRQFARAARLLEQGKLGSRICESPFGSYRLAEYGDIGIEYPMDFAEDHGDDI